MEELSVRIVTLPPFKVVSFHGFGESPEATAIGKANAWLTETRLLDDGKPHRFFGFNNPDPSPGSPNYGYDVWVTVDESVDPGLDGRLISYDGGLYAVTRCVGVEAIGPTWKEFIQWREKSPYRYASDHQWLEEHFNWNAPYDQLVIDLYMPVRK